MSFLDAFSEGFNRFLGGHNDAPPVSPSYMAPDINQGATQYTEGDYQKALDDYNNMSPEERIARQVTGQDLRPPGAPETNPGISNVNLQRQYFNPYVAQLAQAAEGKGPSQAQNALREGTATTVASQYGAAATPSVGGAAQSALYANAQNNAGAAMQSGARQSAQLRAQEMTDARQQLGSALNQQQGLNLQAVGLGTEREKLNQQAGISAGSINAQTGEQNRGGIANIWHQALSSDIRAKEDITPLQSFSTTLKDVGGMPGGIAQQTNPFDYKNYLSDEKQAAAPAAKESGGFLSGLFSDERSKDHIRALEGALAESRRTADTISSAGVQYPGLGSNSVQGREMSIEGRQSNAGIPGISAPEDGGRLGLSRANRDADTIRNTRVSYPSLGGPPTARFADLSTPDGSRSALGPVAPYEYRYKPEFAARTGEDTSPRAGIMAQDLERSPNPALRSAVVNTPMGKAIDQKRAISANLALSAGLDKRLRNIESGIGQEVQYPNLMMSDEHSKETIRALSTALADKHAPPQPTMQEASIIPEGGRMITPLEDSERKLSRMRLGTPDPYGEQRASIENAVMSEPIRNRWESDFTDPDAILPGASRAPRYY